jgi:hypothetical protein
MSTTGLAFGRPGEQVAIQRGRAFGHPIP